MKVYIVISFVDYECCHNVEGVFLDKQKAKEFAENSPDFGNENYGIWEETIK